MAAATNSSSKQMAIPLETKSHPAREGENLPVTAIPKAQRRPEGKPRPPVAMSGGSIRRTSW
ncbi:MAG TPA: hypothetical protein DD827_10750 [Gammaproteobacteria bacterium]|nr:hypothetical protein [Gammaproteobacteria bacterium]